MIHTLRYTCRRGMAWLKRRLWPRFRAIQHSENIPYPKFIQQRILARRMLYPLISKKGLFSLLTPVFDPPAGYFRRLARSILTQDFQDWQWVVVDNGCQNPDVLYLLKYYSRDPRVTLVRAGRPRGIIGGMRLALEHAHHEYVLPVDHDDRLYPDALRVIAASLEACNWPALAYTDEDKILPDGSAGLPYFKPDWDPLLFLNACYIAHQSVLHRKLAWQLGVYTDPDAEGTPDGDAFCRFLAAGYVPVHIPEIVYSWRMHGQSTSLLGVDAKPYVTKNQSHVLHRYLAQTRLGPDVRVRTNALPGIAGSWRVEADSEPVAVFVLASGEPQYRSPLLHFLRRCPDVHSIHLVRSKAWLLEKLRTLQENSWVVTLAEHVIPTTRHFVQEWFSVIKACPSAVLAGGTLLDEADMVLSAGLAWGMGSFLDSPYAGSAVHDYSFGNSGLCQQRCVSSVDACFCMVQVGFLKQSLKYAELGTPLLSAWWGAMAHEMGRRVVYTPYVKARVQQIKNAPELEDLPRYQFLMKHGPLLNNERYYPRYLGLQAKTAFQIVDEAARHHILRQGLCALAGLNATYQATMEAGKSRDFLRETRAKYSKMDHLGKTG
ncbi:MAG TPA: glycosyltransferase [Gemmatales bacterium]|nr:glycosyltransferase [Gemmatales bacterium]